MEVRNLALCESLRTLVVASFRLLKEAVSHGQVLEMNIMEDISITGEGSWSESHYEKPDFYIFVRRNEDHIKQLPEYDHFIQVLVSDDAIKKQLNTLVGTSHTGRMRVDMNQLVTRLLSELAAKAEGFEYRKEQFDELYGDLEDFFYADEFSFMAVAPLENFKAQVDMIEFQGNLKIRKLTHEEIAEMWRNARWHSVIPRDDIPMLKYAI